MNRVFPSKKSVIDSVISGILTAKENFTLWTGERVFLSYAPDNFLSIHISQSIAKLKDKPEIFINASLSDTLKYSLKTRNDYKDFMKKNKIVDKLYCITLDERFDHETKQDSVAKAIISVVNGLRNVKDEYINDIQTMCKVLNNQDEEYLSIDYAIFAFYLDISSTAKIKAKNRITDIVDSFNSIVNKYEYLESKFIGGEINTIENIGEWSVGCFVIEPKRKNKSKGES